MGWDWDERNIVKKGGGGEKEIKERELGGGPDSGGGTGLGGGEGFESGSKSHTSTLDCRVASNPPHSQGEKKHFLFKQVVGYSMFGLKKHPRYGDDVQCKYVV